VYRPMFWTEKVLERYVAASWNRNIIIYKWLHWEKHDGNKIILTDFKWSKGCQSTEKWESCIIDPFCERVFYFGFPEVFDIPLRMHQGGKEMTKSQELAQSMWSVASQWYSTCSMSHKQKYKQNGSIIHDSHYFRNQLTVLVDFLSLSY
jgi:hypothetical protein